VTVVVLKLRSIEHPKLHYAYVHLKADTLEPFYVGEGHGRRAWNFNGRSKHWNAVKRKHGVAVMIAQDNMLEAIAFELERSLIARIGRKDLGHGPLVNHTDGGEGASGRVVPQTVRAAHGAHMKSLFASGALNRRPVALLAHTDALKKVVVCFETSAKFESASAARDWLRDNGHPKAVRHAICDACNGKIATAYGYHWHYLGAPVLKMEKAKRSAANNGKPIVSGKDVIYNSAAEAGRVLGVGYSNIGRCLIGARPSAYGTTWRYATPEETAALKEKGASWAPLSDLTV
jgi:hypothetical protein